MFERVHTELATVIPIGMHRREMESAVAELHRVETHAAERRLALIAAIDDLADGGVDGAGVARARTKSSARAAKKAAKAAKQLAKMPKTTAALAEGRIGLEHVDAAADAAERTSPEAVDAELGDSIGDQPADLFATRARSWAGAKERDADQQARHERHRAQRELSAWTDADGMWCLHARFDPITGAGLDKTLAEKVDQLWRADGGRDGTPDEVRTPAQRRADALTELVGRAATPIATPKRSHPRYQVMVTADIGRLRADDPEGMAELIDGRPIPQNVLERIACQATFAGVVFDTDGSVLWKGRRVRTATDDQWQAVIARDGGCVHCGTDPSRCEVHHVKPWAAPTNGPTDIDALALVCNRAHHLIHDEDWQLVWADGAWHLEPPTIARKPADPKRRPAGNERAA